MTASGELTHPLALSLGLSGMEPTDKNLAPSEPPPRGRLGRELSKGFRTASAAGSPARRPRQLAVQSCWLFL